MKLKTKKFKNMFLEILKKSFSDEHAPKNERIFVQYETNSIDEHSVVSKYKTNKTFS